MNAVLRHLAIRLWATALLGSLVSMMVLPFWQSVLKAQWVAIPVTALLALCFLTLGWGMNRYGVSKIRRLMDEAMAWERAGDIREAQTVYERAVALFDGFWLSPLGRRTIGAMMTGRLARFYLSRFPGRRYTQALVLHHLSRHPSDGAVARIWLAAVVGHPQGNAHYDVMAASISEALPNDIQVQQLLMDYYLGRRRCDFEALQTYQRMWRLQSEWPPKTLLALAKVLMANSHLSDWALSVYLKGYGHGDPYCLEGVVAACHFLRAHSGNQGLMDQAKAVCAGLETDFVQKVLRRFKLPVVPTPADDRKQIPRRTPSMTPGEGIARGWRIVAGATSIGSTQFFIAVKGLSAYLKATARRTGILFRRLQRLRIVAGVAVLILVMAITLMVGYRYRHHVATPEKVPTAEGQPPPVPRPFTIQVAAYLKPEDAQRFVAQLVAQGLEAYASEAVSTHRKWYQVKVSRFETKEQARLYGEALKTKGIIDDFYVTNYKPPSEGV